jgi:hypothetical protein
MEAVGCKVMIKREGMKQERDHKNKVITKKNETVNI